MKRFFCTYFDSNYMIYGLTLFRSLEETVPDFHLYVLCLDETCYQTLKSLDKRIQAIRLSELEAFDPVLAECRNNRSLVEYYFTLTPSLPLYLFHLDPTLTLLAYLDSDLLFYSSPECAFEELSSHSFFIVPHNYSSYAKESEQLFGKYNVAFQIYRNNDVGKAALHWWRERCIEWCRDYSENGRFADQKYLDHLPHIFGGEIVISQNKGLNLAPWNINKFTLYCSPGEEKVDGEPLVFFHYQAYKFILNYFFVAWPFWHGIPVDYSIWNYFSMHYYQALLKTRKKFRKQISWKSPAELRNSLTPYLGRVEWMTQLIPGTYLRQLFRLITLTIFFPHRDFHGFGFRGRF